MIEVLRENLAWNLRLPAISKIPILEHFETLGKSHPIKKGGFVFLKERILEFIKRRELFEFDKKQSDGIHSFSAFIRPFQNPSIVSQIAFLDKAIQDIHFDAFFKR